MRVQNKETEELLIELKKRNRFYQVSNEEQRGRLLELSEPLIRKLIAVGFEEIFVRTLLIGGKDFVDSLYGTGEGIVSEHDAKIIFA
jgi:hypothetical protein